MFSRSLFAAMGVVALSLISSAAQAQIINGGFETPVLSSGNAVVVNGGSTIGAWTAVGNGVVLIQTNYSEGVMGHFFPLKKASTP